MKTREKKTNISREVMFICGALTRNDFNDLIKKVINLKKKIINKRVSLNSKPINGLMSSRFT